MKSKESFAEKVLKIVTKIPKGNVLTYKEIAKMAKSPKAFRAVGNILNKNFNPQIPCHRVIRSDGALGWYNRGQEKKKEILNVSSERIFISIIVWFE